ncbi:MAG: triose-phosphate isomerase family protein, partial [Patescibacteria group bacterium]
IGTQDISQFEQGSHTGEVTASMIYDSFKYTIVGHSERRNQLMESEGMIVKKLEQLQLNHMTSILCVRNEQDTLYKHPSLIAFEPVEDIGTGHSMSVDEVLEMKKKLQLNPNQLFLYGGSVNQDTCVQYIKKPEINGFLVGTAALEPAKFIGILQQYLLTE